MADSPLMTKEFNTAWGSTLLEMADAPADGTMATAAQLQDIGIIDEDSLSFETADGTVYTRKDLNGKVRDKLRQEPEITLNFNIQSPTLKKISEFWKLTDDAVSKRVWVNSLVTTASKSLRMSNTDAYGSMAILIPKAEVNLKPGWETSKGWNFPCSVTALYTDLGTIGFEEVPTPEPETP